MPASLDFDGLCHELDRLKSDFGPRFIIGLSGGGDSLALAHLCARWAQGTKADIYALIIDHQMRLESSREAAQVQAWTQAFGLKAMIHTYDGPRFTKRLQERARDLRHAAFAQAAFEMGGATILLGHTLDDQAETIAFRLSRQTGLDGLAGMARVTHGLIPHAPIARPLLGVRRQALRDYLKSVDQDWIEDPSNQNRAFSRIKVRDKLARFGGHEALARIGDLAAALKEAQVAAVHDLSQRCDVRVDAGVTQFSVTAFLGAPAFLQTRLLAQLIQTQAPIAADKLSRLVIKMGQQDFKSATLAGALVSRRGGVFVMTKAPPRTQKRSSNLVVRCAPAKPTAL